MSDQEKSAFFVDAYSDPVIVKIRGRVSFMNSSPLRDFFQRLIPERDRFIVDFSECATMDSTFLGILAGAALELRKKDPSGTIVLCRLGARNLELVRNLGLHRIMTVDSGDTPLAFEKPGQPLEARSGKAELENARLVLEAHENLIEANEHNLNKFQDVVSFLKNQVERM